MRPVGHGEWDFSDEEEQQALDTAERPCGSCGEPSVHIITLHGHPMPVCLRHLNHWRTPPADYTCPTTCVEMNHPGRDHAEWIEGS